MRKLARPAIGAAALALVAAGTSCGQQSSQEPQNQAQPSQAQQPQTQNEAQPPQAQQPQARNEAQPPQAQQPKAQEHQAQESQHQAQQRQQPQNQAQPGQQSGNENSNQNGSQNTVENLSEGEMRRIQQALEQKGFKVGPLDGKLGPMTKRALSQFQRKQGLRETGTPDEQTLAALGIGGGASTTGQGTSGSGGTNPSQAPSNNPTAQPPQQQPTGRR